MVAIVKVLESTPEKRCYTVLKYIQVIGIPCFNIFSSFMRAHAQVMNEYCGDEMSTEVVVERNLWTEIVDRRRK